VKVIEQATPPERIVYVPTPLPEPAPVPVAEVVEPKPLPIIQPPAPLPAPLPVKVEVAPEPSPAPVKRVVVIEREPQIDWLWYEKMDEEIDSNLDLGWVESEDSPDDKLPPPDLWWHRVARTDTTSAIID
jgi:hypothetical protein